MRPCRYDPLKRLIDVLASTFLLVLTAPIQLLTAILVRALLGSPVFFRQPRPGRDGGIFDLVKFRTMRHLDADQDLVTDTNRLTAFGRFLRSTSLDELPTLWNVLKGDMSLVGPRPLLIQYLDRYTPEQQRRHEVRPGITGLAQVNGRNTLSWEQKFALDVEYVDQRSLLLDLRILLLTAVKVAKRDGITAEGDSTMPEFMGSGGAGDG